MGLFGFVWRYYYHTLGGQQLFVSECPRGARMAVKDYSYNDVDAVRSRGWDLVSRWAFLVICPVAVPILHGCFHSVD